MQLCKRKNYYFISITLVNYILKLISFYGNSFLKIQPKNFPFMHLSLENFERYFSRSLSTMGGSPGDASEEPVTYELCSFSKLSVTSPTSQLILQPFCRFTYVTAHSPTFTLLHLRHSSFSNPSFAFPTSQALHLRHLASRPCFQLRYF